MNRLYRRHAGGARATISAIRARGAITGQNVQYVLAFSLAGIIIGVTIVYFLHFR